jgi:hypothetical protein
MRSGASTERRFKSFNKFRRGPKPKSLAEATDQVRPFRVMTLPRGATSSLEIGRTDPLGSHDVAGPSAGHEQKHDPRGPAAF